MISRTLVFVIALSGMGVVLAQDESTSNPVNKDQTKESAPEKPGSSAAKSGTNETIKDTAVKLSEDAKQEMKQIAEKVDQDPRAKQAAAGILQPIYVVAEALAFPAFHWLAFALMAAGVVSFTLQLALGKLVVLMRLGFSIKEIASDAVGLAISVFGLVLTTQAAAENSTFTQSPAAVISATVVGAFVGIILYFWGQSQELQAAAGRSRTNTAAKR